MLKVIQYKNKYFSFSAAVLIISLAIMLFNVASGRGLFNFDVEFSGGTSFQVNIGKSFDNNEVADIVRNITGQQSPQIQKAGDGTQVMIKIRSIDQETRTKLIAEFENKYGITKDAINYSDVSPTVSADMQRAAIMAVLVSCVAMLVYISIRFRDIKLGSSAILALMHDALIMLAIYGVLRIPLNYSFIAAILTILGYSINATIIIFDRIRENKNLMRKRSIGDIIDTSVNQTLRRTMFTSITLLIAIFFLYILGVPSIKEFSLPIMLGVVFGTYSSICLSSNFWYAMLPAKLK